ncbi:MAG TPA: hypothetical protein VGH98_16065 [Gemmatimonadaceae bacterium]|jgi:hypothetical protein
MRRSLLCALALSALGFAIETATAQTAAVATPPHVDSVSHRLVFDSTRIQPAQFLYQLSLMRDSASSPIGDQRFVVSTLDYAGTPTLLLTRNGMEGVALTSDTLVVRLDDLRPLHWVSVHGLASVAAEFTPDSIFGAMTSPLGRHNVVLANRGDLLVNTMAVDVVLASLPLSATWRDSASLIVIDAGGSTLTPATLSVEGEEHVTVPAGDFDCWIVSLEAERASERLWVTKQGQIVVRAEQVLPELGATLVRTLAQSDSPALVPTSARLPH